MSLKRFSLFVVGAAVLWPSPLFAQQTNPPILGFLTSGTIRALNKTWVSGFNRGLAESGYAEGKNVIIERREAEDRYDRLPGLAAELVEKKVSVIVAAGGPVSALAVKKVTSTVPMVFTTIADPVKSGLVASLNHPGGNATGMAGLTSELDAKRMEMLLQLKPSATTIGVLINPNRPGVEANNRELEAAAKAIGRKLIFAKADADHPIAKAVEGLVEQKIDALVVTADPFFNFRRAEVIALAARYALPAVYQWREFVLDGGLISYGPSIGDAYYQTGVYAGRILKGEKPGELPVIQPSKFELVISRKTARTLGLEIPTVMLARADEVIE